MSIAREIRSLGGEEILHEGDVRDLNAAVARVMELMRDGRWYRSKAIKEASGLDSGMRRMRELRKHGWKIERRRIKGSRDFEYRMTKQVPNLSQASLSF